MIDITQVFDGTPPTTGVALTVTRPSTNVLDMLVSRDIGNGNAVYCNVLFPVALATGTSLQIAYQTSNTEGSGYVDLILSPVILTATDTWSTAARLPLPPFELHYRGYVRRGHCHGLAQRHPGQQLLLHLPEELRRVCRS